MPRLYLLNKRIHNNSLYPAVDTEEVSLFRMVVISMHSLPNSLRLTSVSSRHVDSLRSGLTLTIYWAGRRG